MNLFLNSKRNFFNLATAVAKIPDTSGIFNIQLLMNNIDLSTTSFFLLGNPDENGNREIIDCADKYQVMEGKVSWYSPEQYYTDQYKGWINVVNAQIN